MSAPDFAMAAQFLEVARVAHERGDDNTFRSARHLLNLSLSDDKTVGETLLTHAIAMAGDPKLLPRSPPPRPDPSQPFVKS